MSKVILMCAVLALAGCAGEAERVSTAGAGGYRVETLFTHDGCTAYRFYDGRTVHFVKCGDGSATARWREACGKNCIREVAVQTERRDD